PQPSPQPPLPLPPPEPAPGPVPEPEPEPGPGPEDAFVDPSQRAELEETRRALETERADAEAFVRSRTQDLLSKEELLFARERAIASKEEQVEAHARAATERLAELEKDSARREVLRFLGAIPGMSASQADVIATAFPDIVSLTAADEKALTQCKGVTDALARAIRLELAPGELEEERRSSRLREEAQAFVEEGDYAAALECYDRLLRSRPEETSVWFDRAELLVLLDRPEEALQAYTRILDVDRGNRQSSYERANLLFALGRLSGAIALRWNYPEPWLVKGEILLSHDRPTEALECFEKVASFEPQRIEAWAGAARADAALGRRGEADSALANATRLGADHLAVRAAR